MALTSGTELGPYEILARRWVKAWVAGTTVRSMSGRGWLAVDPRGTQAAQSRSRWTAAQKQLPHDNLVHGSQRRTGNGSCLTGSNRTRKRAPGSCHKRQDPKPVTPEGIVGNQVTSDEERVLVKGPEGKYFLYPLKEIKLPDGAGMLALGPVQIILDGQDRRLWPHAPLSDLHVLEGLR